MNFKAETIMAVKESGHSLEDVMFIGSQDGKYRMTMEEFEKYSDFTYDSGYGSVEIPEDLIIYFRDKSYIIRGEYDGSEWWNYNEPLDYSENDEHKKFNKLKIKNCERSVAELNTEGEII